jgi:hypothetical protein
MIEVSHERSNWPKNVSSKGTSSMHSFWMLALVRPITFCSNRVKSPDESN